MIRQTGDGQQFGLHERLGRIWKFYALEVRLFSQRLPFL